MKINISVRVPNGFFKFYYNMHRVDRDTLLAALEKLFEEQISEPFHQLNEERLKFHIKRTAKKRRKI